MARAIELAELNPLPGAEHQPTLFQDHLNRLSEQRAFDMRGRGPLDRAVSILEWNDPFELHEQIADHIRVGILLNGYSRSRVRDEDSHQSILSPGFFDNPLNLAGDVHHLAAGVGMNPYFKGHDLDYT